MIIQITGGNDGWGAYVKHGTKSKPRDPNCVHILRGDITLGDKIVNAGKWKQNAYHIILSFKGKVDRKTIQNVLDEFETSFMMGFNENEYHIDAVLHTDTDDDHVHIRIPKINLLTETQLRLYFDKKDRPRLELIRDFLDAKYELESPNDNLKLIKEEYEQRINNWRTEHSQETIDFSTKKARNESKMYIIDKVLSLHERGELTCLNDVSEFLETLGLTIERYGYDQPKNFHYVTVSNFAGKVRVDNEIFSQEFWDLDENKRAYLIESNLTPEALKNRHNKGNLESLKKKLQNVNKKRYQTVTRTYASARKRVTESYAQVMKEGKLTSDSEDKNNINKGKNYDRPHRRSLQRTRAERERQERDLGTLQKEFRDSYTESLKGLVRKRGDVEQELRKDAEYVASTFRKQTGGVRGLLNRIVSSIGHLRKQVERIIIKINSRVDEPFSRIRRIKHR